MKSHDKTAAQAKELYINEIEFHSKTEIYLFGFINIGGQFRETRFTLSRKDLQVLLSRNKHVGIEILWKIENLFVQPHGVPVNLNLIDLFGTTQVFVVGEPAPGMVMVDNENNLAQQLPSLQYTFL